MERFALPNISYFHAERKMRACFLGQNLFALGFGVATLQAPAPMADDHSGAPPQSAAGRGRKKLSNTTALTPGPCNKSATPGG
jgi:hypothetical protein